MLIAGSVALVTGANRGLGRALANALLEQGAKTVYAAVRDVSSIRDPRLTPIQVDVTDPVSTGAAARRCADTTLVINNAGVLAPGSLLGPSTLDGARMQLETNFFGPVNMTRAFAPVLAGNGGGALVNVLSVLS